MNTKQCSRRRLFKFAGIGAAFAALGAAFTTRAWAHGHGGFGQGPIDPAKMEAHLDRMLKHLYVEIDATEAQKAKIGPIVKQAAKDLMPAHEAMHDTRKQAIALLSADKVDRAGIEKLRAAKLQAADAASRRVTQALSDVAEVLTPEQRKHLAELAGRHHRWHR
jgi:periplasmic protein CpxP/Spy